MDTRCLAQSGYHQRPDEKHHECFVCYGGMVYIGHLVEEDGEEVEVVDALPCHRCAAE